jgi:hypothetical protein
MTDDNREQLKNAEQLRDVLHKAIVDTFNVTGIEHMSNKEIDTAGTAVGMLLSDYLITMVVMFPGSADLLISALTSKLEKDVKSVVREVETLRQASCRKPRH